MFTDVILLLLDIINSNIVIIIIIELTNVVDINVIVFVKYNIMIMDIMMKYIIGNINGEDGTIYFYYIILYF